MTERIILFLFLFLFTCTKQASSLHLLVHFTFIAAILLSSTSSAYVQIRKWMDKLRKVSSWRETKQNKTLMSWLTFIMVLFTNFAEGSARIMFSLNWKFTYENNIIKCSLRLFVSTLHHSRPPAKFLPHSPNSFRRYFNVKSHLKYLCKYKSWKFIFCLHFFIHGVESAWQAGLLLPFLGQSHITGHFVSFRRKTYYKLALKLHYHLPVYFE